MDQCTRNTSRDVCRRVRYHRRAPGRRDLARGLAVRAGPQGATVSLAVGRRRRRRHTSTQLPQNTTYLDGGQCVSRHVLFNY